MISFIFAMDEENAIGKNNNLPWHIPDDLRRFKKITMGHPIIMGRKTYDSIGKPLPGRENIIITRNKTFVAEGCIVFYDIKEMMEYINKQNEEFFVIGGAEIFRLFLPFVTKMYVTKINHRFAGDVFFPEMDWSSFTISNREKGKTDPNVPYAYEYILYEK
ncbi:dihydrofolate reductase [Caldibacillus lycopersici]|uniref:Dihydrofolate reductase n=1 Tax=Perspicuibacillus lycopersici TaxID=1325689 RepID=A0AAE3ISF7_9BACI|nr:dihydrofolate reductase [Perspicuibacillus lycopersici]MCU9613636.1 dihydrofolate reductase [Perspicuibacillus lycopersici]